MFFPVKRWIINDHFTSEFKFSWCKLVLLPTVKVPVSGSKFENPVVWNWSNGLPLTRETTRTRAAPAAFILSLIHSSPSLLLHWTETERATMVVSVGHWSRSPVVAPMVVLCAIDSAVVVDQPWTDQTSSLNNTSYAAKSKITHHTNFHALLNLDDQFYSKFTNNFFVKCWFLFQILANKTVN